MSSRLETTADSSALETIHEPHAFHQKETVMAGKQRFVLPLVPVQGISLEPRHAVAPSPISITAGMPNPWPTPSRNAWLVSGSTAQVREGQ